MWILFLVLMTGLARADVYVITAPDKSVYSLSEKDDAVVQDGYKKFVIKKKNISDLTITIGQEKMYDFDGNTFTLNAKKVTDKNAADQASILNAQAIQKNRETAIAKLADAISKVDKNDLLTDDEIQALLLN